MDMETFKTLAEVLAFECKDDPSKYDAFCDVFYGDYKNKGPSIIDLNAQMGSVTLLGRGQVIPAYITSYTWTDESQSYSSWNDTKSYMSSGGFTLKLDIKGRF